MMHPAPAANTLIFIPDISGFTEFVRGTEITHSQHIIEELLEVLIDGNEIGLEVSEIEGDAILFYKMTDELSAAELFAQIQRMYVDFHAHRKKYESQRICQCGACSTANRLKLKFVAHYGEVAMKQVKEHSKLFGEDVITAHRLLKNSLEDDEYALMTSAVADACSDWVDAERLAWTSLSQGEEDYDVGRIRHWHLELASLKKQVPEPTVEDYGLPGETIRVLEYERVVDVPLDMAFNVLSDVSIRHEWLPLLKDVSDLNTSIAQNGTGHRCVLKIKGGDPYLVAHDFEAEQDLVRFSETDHKQGFTTVYTLRRIGPSLTRVHVAYLLGENPVKLIFFKLFFKKKLEKYTIDNWDSFSAYCKNLIDSGREAPSQIVLAAA